MMGGDEISDGGKMGPGIGGKSHSNNIFLSRMAGSYAGAPVTSLLYI